jgi:hypothetical protein
MFDTSMCKDYKGEPERKDLRELLDNVTMFDKAINLKPILHELISRIEQLESRLDK